MSQQDLEARFPLGAKVRLNNKANSLIVKEPGRIDSSPDGPFASHHPVYGDIVWVVFDNPVHKPRWIDAAHLDLEN